MFKTIVGFHIITLLTGLNMIVGMLFTCGKHLHDPIILVRRDILDYQTISIRHFPLICLYQFRTVSDHVFVC